MVFAGTLAAAQGPDLRGLSFRTVIVDECGQATEPAALQALRHMTAGFRSRFILVGNHRQLPPVVPDSDPDDPPIRFDFPEELAPSGLTHEHTLKSSLFERLASRYPQRLTTLRDQYRMNAPICDLVSNTFYEGRLQPGTPEVAERRLTCWFSANGIRPGAGFVADGPPVQFIDTSNDVGGKDRDASLGDDSRSNEREAEIIAALVSELVDGLNPAERAIVLSQLGIISPYRRQNNAIQLALAKRDPQLSASVRVDTVDRFQGGEKEIVFVSLTNSNAHATIGRLHAEWRRMNVAISRAKRMLVIIGDRGTFTAASDEAEESAKARYRRLFAEIDRLCAAGEARIAASEGMGPVT